MFRRHVFVCQTRRPDGDQPSCGARGAADLYSWLLGALDRRPDLAREVAVTACGCLGFCQDGPMIVVYPEGIWYARVRPEDLEEIVERHLFRGEPVERLQWQPS